MAQRFARTRSPHVDGNSISVTLPKTYLTDHGILKDGEIDDKYDFSVFETEDGGIKFVPEKKTE